MSLLPPRQWPGGSTGDAPPHEAGARVPSAATARPVNTLLSSEQQRNHCQEKLYSAHASKTQNTARAAWSQLSAAPCAILSFIWTT